MSLRPAGWVALCAALLAGVGYVDYATGSKPSVAVFYLLPVTLLASKLGRRWGLAGALCAAGAWYVADALTGGTYGSSAYRLWNAAVMLAFFLFAAWVVSALRDAYARQQELARTDDLTGVANRREFMIRAEMELRRAGRYGHPFSVAYLDLDHFKAVNDARGHHEGDRLLRGTAQALLNGVRDTDLVARMGGDEFVILMPETGSEAAATVEAKIHGELRDRVMTTYPGVTLSVGLVTWLSPPQSVDEMVRSADALMYAAKQSGRDRVERKVLGN